MNIDDDALRALWQRQQPPPQLADELTARIVRHRRAEKVRRTLEVALTLAGVALLTWPAADGRLTAVQWLLIPFFSVFLVVGWAVVLRPTPEQQLAASEPVSVYARIRKVQLRDRLRHLKLAAVSAFALLGYAAASLAFSYVLGTTEWREAAVRLAAWAAVWTIGSWWLVRRKRAAVLSEYRCMTRIAAQD